MKLIIVITLAFTILGFYAIVQSPEAWFTRDTNLKEGLGLSGKLPCQMDSNVVLYLNQDGIMAYPAILRNPFKLPDYGSGESQVYFTVPVEPDNVNEKIQFYEVVARGKPTLPCWEKLIRKVWPKGKGLARVNRFYCLDDSDGVAPLETFKKSIRTTMSGHLANVNNFIRRYNLKMYVKLDLQQVFAYYNSLSTNNQGKTIFFNAIRVNQNFRLKQKE